MVEQILHMQKVFLSFRVWRFMDLQRIAMDRMRDMRGMSMSDVRKLYDAIQSWLSLKHVVQQANRDNNRHGAMISVIDTRSGAEETRKDDIIMTIKKIVLPALFMASVPILPLPDPIVYEMK